MDRLRSLPVIGTALRVQERYTEDRADALAAAIGLFGFLSLFPLLALVLSIVGRVLEGDPVLRARAINAVTQSVPALSTLAGGKGQVAATINAITENPGSLSLFGSIFLLVAGLRIASGAQQASSAVFRVELPTGLMARLTQLRALAATGTLALLGAALGGTAGVDLSNGVEGLARSLVLLGLSLLLNVALFAVAYRLFTPGPGPAWRVLLPGAVLGGTGWMALQVFGATYISQQAGKEGSAYGALGTIVGLLLLLYIAGRLYLYGAELAAVLGGVGADDVPGPAFSTSGEDDDEVLTAAHRRSVELSPVPDHDEPATGGDLVRLVAAGAAVTVTARVVSRLLQR